MPRPNHDPRSSHDLAARPRPLLFISFYLGHYRGFCAGGAATTKAPLMSATRPVQGPHDHLHPKWKGPATPPFLPVSAKLRYFAYVEEVRKGWPVSFVRIFRRFEPRARTRQEAEQARAEIFRSTELSLGEARAWGTEVFSYERRYSMLSTFEPFVLDGRDYALISPDYTKTTAVELSSGVLIHEGKSESNTLPNSAGFCPASFFVPELDPELSQLGSDYDPDQDSWPDGCLGFVAGCHWGDDSSWKIQTLDLSQLTQGVIVREPRFGYVSLPQGIALQDAVQLDAESKRVRLAVSLSFELGSGAVERWELEDLQGFKELAQHFVAREGG